MHPMLVTRIALVSLMLLAPAPAWAERAWVLWFRPAGGVAGRAGERGPWEPKAAAATQLECEAESTTLVRQFERWAGGEGSQYICLADTVDPRGPKGRE